ncbi:MAG: L-serine ammonia-lyase, iron-sulfur-dependent, subunit alpha, partial [Erysipelotrichaceae bacterium]|nr:L-serine ammonia-lyase, iron-sulfur-dependent, subunit alpha [Erysipelotrichaceae bacterium]
MQSLKELYKTGAGPSSSHTLAPFRACNLFKEVNGTFPYYEVELYGSLSLTGKGHRTDKVIREVLGDNCQVTSKLEWDEEFPNGFYIKGLNDKKEESIRWTVFSIGGGSIRIREYPVDYNDEIYEEDSYQSIKEHLLKDHISLKDYAYRHEEDLHEYLCATVESMCSCVRNGLAAEGFLPGELKMVRSAKKLYEEALEAGLEQDRLKMMAYAYAAGEENADGKICVTSPTLGSCGIMASLIYYLRQDMHYTVDELADALAVGGIFGNIVKSNATISGAVGCCQAEIGVAVAMAAASYAYILGMDTDQIEYAAEIGIEHHLGLTCDPIKGYVMIPCIERNAVGILRAIDAAVLAKYMSKVKGHVVSFDMVVKTMNETGKMIPIELKETSTGGLA